VAAEAPDTRPRSRQARMAKRIVFIAQRPYRIN
jgi:hypothetical protein